jgi:hypothetical protein
MKKIILALLSTLLIFSAGCSGQNTDSSSATENNSSIISAEEEESGVLYQIEDVVKSDLLWDTQTLFNTEVEIRDENLDLGTNIQTFKFKSASYKNLENTWVFAAIGKPTSKKPKNGYPAVLLIHGGGGTVSANWMNYWMDKGYIALAFDVFGHQLDENLQRVDNPESGPKETGVGSNLDGVQTPYDSWVYHVIYNAIMCNNILRSHANVDEDRIVVTGNSWGGYVTSLLSGVDKRFAAFAPLNGCGYVYRDTTWLKDGTFGGADKQKWIELYDPSSYLPYATKPMLFVSGLTDEYFSTYNRIQSASLIKGKAFYSQRTNLQHAGWTNAEETYNFFQHVLYNQPTMTLVEDIVVEGNKATFQYENPTFKEVHFVYTTSKDADSHNWVWESVKVDPVDGVYSYEIPADATAYLFELKTSKTLSQSTNVVIVESDTQYC